MTVALFVDLAYIYIERYIYISIEYRPTCHVLSMLYGLCSSIRLPRGYGFQCMCGRCLDEDARVDAFGSFKPKVED